MSKSVLCEELLKELEDKETAVTSKQRLIDEFPQFKRNILQMSDIVAKRKDKIDLGYRYKDLPLKWGIIGCYMETAKNITNYPNETEAINKVIFPLYFNSLSLYERHEKYGIKKLSKYAFFFDSLNTTFYVERERLIEFLDNANEWYLKAGEKARKDDVREQIEELKREMEELKGDN